MPRKGKSKKRPDSFTLVVVPHDEKPSFSVRIPFWSLYAAAGLCAAGALSLGYLALDYRDAAHQLAELRRGGQMEIVRENGLRSTIVADLKQQEKLLSVISQQQENAASEAADRESEAIWFNEQVNQLYSQMAELEEFKADIRRLVGLDKLSPTPVPQAPADGATGQTGSTDKAPAIGPLEPLAADRVASNVSNRGSDSGVSVQTAIHTTNDILDNVVPQQKADLEALRREVQDRLAKVDGGWSDPNQLSQKLSLYDASPRIWPMYGVVEARFGYDGRRLELGAQPFHKGIDISNGVGTPVKAPQDGVVVSFGWNGTYGLAMQVQHNFGWSTYYAHLSGAAVKVGDKVKKGQTIAFVGMTGLTTGSHLHYEIHLNGTPVDPARYLGR